MDAKLQALKVADLKNLLTAAGLPVSGNKPDLIARLLENPSAIASLADGAAGASENGAKNGKAEEEDLLAFDGEEKKTAGAAAPATTAAPANTGASATTAPASAAATTEKKDDEPPAPSEAEKKSAVIEELNKRLKRLQKFGGSATEIDDLQKQIQRIEKFGLTEKDYAGVGMKKLDTGLAKSGKEVKKAAADAAKASKAEPKPEPKPETEEEKAARIAREEADEAARKRRLERFGPVQEKRKAEDEAGKTEEKKAKADA